MKNFIKFIKKLNNFCYFCYVCNENLYCILHHYHNLMFYFIKPFYHFKCNYYINIITRIEKYLKFNSYIEFIISKLF